MTPLLARLRIAMILTQGAARYREDGRLDDARRNVLWARQILNGTWTP
jgi:hypothetical protein